MKRLLRIVVMKQLNKSKGSILQVVLIVFMVLVLNISVFYLNIIENSRAIKRTKRLNNERLIELSIIRYYKEMILNDILLSNVIEIENYVINYTVDDFGNYYYIETIVKKYDNEFGFNLEIELDSLVILSFEYR
ncbi:hypothetical protein DXB31_03855 [Thomasclavelia spiroformis]|nr:hypothetical protein DXB31_03855 [Thomasclavelia spiroformis]